MRKVLDRSHERTSATRHMPLARGAGDRNRRERREWVTLDHNQKLGSALINYARAKEEVRRARAHKELANPALNDAHVDGFGPGWPNVEKVLAGMQLPNTNANNNGGLAVRSILTLMITCGVAAANTTRKLLATGLDQAWLSWQWTTALEPWLHELEQRIDMLAITTAPQSGGAALLLYARMHALVPGGQPGLMHEDVSAAFRHAEAVRHAVGGPRAAWIKGSSTSWWTSRTYRSSSTSRRCSGCYPRGHPSPRGTHSPSGSGQPRRRAAAPRRRRREGPAAARPPRRAR